MAKSQNANSEIQKTSKNNNGAKPSVTASKASQAVEATEAEIAALAGPAPEDSSTAVETSSSDAELAAPVAKRVEPLSPVDIVAREIQAFDIGYQTRVQQEHEEQEAAKQQAAQALKPEGADAQTFRQQLETKSGLSGQRFERAVSKLYGRIATSDLGTRERVVTPTAKAASAAAV